MKAKKSNEVDLSEIYKGRQKLSQKIKKLGFKDVREYYISISLGSKSEFLKKK